MTRRSSEKVPVGEGYEQKGPSHQPQQENQDASPAFPLVPPIHSLFLTFLPGLSPFMPLPYPTALQCGAPTVSMPQRTDPSERLAALREVARIYREKRRHIMKDMPRDGVVKKLQYRETGVDGIVAVTKPVGMHFTLKELPEETDLKKVRGSLNLEKAL
uniref:Uncharacterized protein n=1 Tax=Chromera velia CCMP2878 TaxID=1169474 RepID=A0A0G4F4U0_9ALVE|eukprot:Cvel_15145.t1-p1 / transcript=Cvel_15145.t1 / gene=Cvel_15145 / organism=Chromera_velia_CCMP2878 / gene_product=hypothetical protein / transcript_product=hypothetical protein / location=Cvel_scaffold1105:53459-54505(+) / protein_length=158 / sequence_SO=supercontig / SO=protein_coding / is_pseudo=false